MKTKLIKILSLVILFVFVSTVNAYDFSTGTTVRRLDDTLKAKADLIVKKKINTSELIKKYLKALKKINVSALSANKQALYYYLLSKLDSRFVISSIDANNNQVANNSSTGASVPDSTNSSISVQNNNSNQNSTNTTIKEYSLNEQTSINVPITLPSVVSVSNSPRAITYGGLPTDQKDYIEQIKSKVADYAEVDDNYGFNEYGKNYRVKINEYYNVDYANHVSAYLTLSTIGSEILLKKGDGFVISKGGFTFEQKISIKELTNQVKFAGDSEDPVIFQIRNGSYYAYSIYDYKYFIIPDDGVFLSQFNGVTSLSNYLLIRKEGKYLLVTEFGEYKLFDTSILKNSSNPLVFLKSFGKDLYFYKGNDFTTLINQINTKTNEIIVGTTNESQRIQKIYSRLTANLTYDTYTIDFVKGKFDESIYLANVNNEVFTGIGTFKSKNGVCDGFTKLLQYMLTFAGIQNVNIETGDADVGGGKIISHAWVEISGLYYDPTWDIYSAGDTTKFKWYAISQADMYKTHFKK